MILPNLTADRRRYPRVAMTRPVKVRHGVTGKYVAGETIDLSDGGVLLRLEKAMGIEPGQPVRVGIVHSPRQALILADEMIEGRVIRRLGHGDTQHVAVSFDCDRSEQLAEAC